MKILSIGNFGVGWDGSICDEEHIAKALESLGHGVIRWQREEVGEARNSNLVDFILVAQWDGYHQQLMANLKAYNSVPVVYWAFDYQAEGQPWHEALVAGADLYLSKRIADSKYPNWRWLSQDFAPEFLDKYRGDIEPDIDVLFTGSYLPWATERTETLKKVDEKYNLQIYSFTPDAWKAEGFKNVHGPAMDQELPYLYARSKVNLSIDHTLEAGYWSDRNAQIMACGGYVLSRYVPLAEARFGCGIDYFHNVNDCLNKIENALGDSGYRQTVADIGYDLAHRQDKLMVGGRAYDLMIIVESIL